MKIAGIQFACSVDKDKNVENALRTIDAAISNGASIICFQELFNLPWFPKDRDEKAFELSESIYGDTVKAMREKAKSAGIVILLPIFEKDKTRFYNSCVVVDENGEVAGVYRKIHIPDISLWEEKFYFSAGDKGFPVFQTSFGKIGIQISWDNLYPEGTRILTLKGADIIFAPTACAFKSQHLWQTAISGNAIANGVFIMRVNRAGSEEKQDFYGASFCVNPEGELIGGPTGIADSVLLADVDFDYLQHIRREWPLLRERKPENYKEILSVTP
ncbi:MAG TPA: nitrilase-related carbon-nitrogen hydrolase [Syntrophorhabdus sp.]|jgi:predicted amidohydrolase|nr:nitrilase-related carbon-nitrogen hydrolase [Syntrophorhabdus sp.]